VINDSKKLSSGSSDCGLARLHSRMATNTRRNPTPLKANMLFRCFLWPSFGVS
jgi:hypothetical protein